MERGTGFGLLTLFLFNYNTNARSGNSDKRNNDNCRIHNLSPFYGIIFSYI